jgi:hypothetical protein
MAIKRQSFLKAGLLIAASAGLLGCVYDVSLGFASDGYYDDAYGCDPYSGYDVYYSCDYSHAFSNIGFGGGWYDNYYYPGHGIFLFDRLGRRYPMREEYPRYWGQRRHDYYREHRGHDRVGRGYDDRREGGREDMRDGSRAADDQRRGGGGRVTGVTPAPNIDDFQDRGRGPEYGKADGRPDRRVNGGSNADTAPAPRRQSSPIRENVVSVEQLPEPSAEPRRSKAPRRRAPEGGVERPE